MEFPEAISSYSATVPRQIVLEQVVDRSPDRSQWRPQCVRNRGQEGRLQFVALSEGLGATGLSQEPGSLERDSDETGDCFNRPFFEGRRYQDKNAYSPDSDVERCIGQLFAGESKSGGIDTVDFTGTEDAGNDFAREFDHCGACRGGGEVTPTLLQVAGWLKVEG